MHPLVPILLRWFAGICIAIAASTLPALWWQEPNIKQVTNAWRKDRGEEFLSSWKNIDLRINDAAGPGNVAIRFPGFSAENPSHVRTVQNAVWRGSFAIYPRRVFAATPGTVTNNGRDVLNTPFDPSVQWLQDHQIRAVLNLVARGDGFEVRGQFVPPRGGR